MKRLSNPGIVGIIVFLVAAAVSAEAQSLRISVTNPSGADRPNEPVVVDWGNAAATFASVRNDELRLLDEDSRSLPFQLDDFGGDGAPDELAFAADFGGRQTRTFTFTRADTLPSPIGPLRTDAGNWKRIDGIPQPVDDDDGPGLLRNQSAYVFDGIGWESELIGYRLYLDERNAIDIQGKRIPGLQWNFIGKSGVDYQLDAYWGMDVLHVGSSLGFGGIGFWEKESVVKPVKLARRRCRVLARGPVRVVVRVDYDGWKTQGNARDITSIFIQYAGNRITEHRLILRSPGEAQVAAGIVKHRNATVTWNPKTFLLTSFGAQARAGENLLMTLAFEPPAVVGKTESKSDDLVILSLEQGRTMTIRMLAAWDGEKGINLQAEEVKRLTTTFVEGRNQPLRVRVKNEFPK